METVRLSAAMTDWAKAMAQVAFNKMDYDRVAAEMATTRINQMKNPLGH